MCFSFFHGGPIPKFISIVSTLRNFQFQTENPIELYSKTLDFTAQLRRMCLERRKDQVIIPKKKKFHGQQYIQKNCDDNKMRIEFLNRLKKSS